MGQLTATEIKTLTEAGRYNDGDGLILNVAAGGSKRWILRVQHEGKRRDIGLSPWTEALSGRVLIPSSLADHAHLQCDCGVMPLSANPIITEL